MQTFHREKEILAQPKISNALKQPERLTQPHKVSHLPLQSKKKKKDFSSY